MPVFDVYSTAKCITAADYRVESTKHDEYYTQTVLIEAILMITLNIPSSIPLRFDMRSLTLPSLHCIRLRRDYGRKSCLMANINIIINVL